MTIADKIRTMDDTELANFICDTAGTCNMCKYRSEKGCTIMDYLHREVEED